MRIIRKLQPLFVALAILLLVVLLRSQWDELSRHPWQLNPAWLAASALFLLASWALEVQIWRTLLQVLGACLPYFAAVRAWFISAIMRYIPGNIWQPLSITVMAQRRGVAPEATLTSVVLYQLINLLAATPIAAVYVLTTGNWGLFTQFLGVWTPLLAGAMLAPIAVFLVRPAWLLELVNWLLAKLRRPPLATQRMTRSAMAWVLLLTVCDWLLWGSCFAALAFALQPYSPAEMMRLLPHLVAANAIATAIGFISLLTPSGIGVREGAFYVLLAPIMGGGAATVLALAMRLWTMLGELVAAGLCLLFPERSAAAGAEPRLPAPDAEAAERAA